ncbi:MAG: ATP-dependent DNA helicase [Patescibacteria group bacterium]
METFEKAYTSLNLEQKRAVDAIEGPVMVIAGPGTGKTQILTLRIANILKQTGAPADAILALTFTESAAANMRRRLVSLIGSRGYYVAIHTFHGFCNKIIRDHPEYFPGIIGGRSATAVDQISILRDVVLRMEAEHLRPYGDSFFYIPSILSAIRSIKNEGISPNDFEELVETEKEEFGKISDLYHEKGAHQGKMKGEYQKKLVSIEKNKELASAYREYQNELRLRKLYDFEDMILEVVRSFSENEAFLLEIQENYQYILVDEHQDTNGAQNKVLELIASFQENPNLFVVGDEKQAIFRFQGASLENFLYFKNKYPVASLVSLTTNYRSTQSILDSAESLISHNKATIHHSLFSVKKESGTPLRLLSFEKTEAELYFLAVDIARKIDEGVAPEEIAILYRENRDAFPIADFLAKKGIPHVVESDENLLSDPDIKKLIAILAAVMNFGSDEHLIKALHIDFLEIEPIDIYTLVERDARGGESIFDMLFRKNYDANRFVNIPAVHSFVENLRAWKVKSENEPFLRLFEEIVRESGFLAHVLKGEEMIQKMEKLDLFFGEAKGLVGDNGFYKLKDFMDHLVILEEHGVSIKGRHRRGLQAVRLMTAHRAKGLEFEYVYVAGATDGHWGNKKSHNHFALPFKTSASVKEFEKNEDERRLFYMALTRAKKGACITFAKVDANGRERVPSQFLEEVRAELVRIEDGVPYEEEFEKSREIVFAKNERKAPSVTEKEFLNELFLTRGLSPTHLNNYLRCPWEYFYKNLIRIPSVPSKAQIYGIAVHGALQSFFEKKKSGEEAGIPFVIERFNFYLSKYPLSEREKELLLEKGRKNFSRYVEANMETWNYNAIVEFNVRGIILTDNVKITGKIDKIELSEDGGNIFVVDYKTKKPESRNWISGEVGDSGGDYKRQLVFYKLLLDRYPEKKFNMKFGVIDFTEPNDKGVFKKEIFEIESGEVLELEQAVLRVADEIKSLAFWDKRCERKDCNYCALRDTMRA